MRQAVHVLVACVFWVLLIGAWVVLAVQGKVTAEGVLDGLEVVGAMGLVVGAATLYWVRHNVGIYRRKGPRRGRPIRRPDTQLDRLSRPVRWQFEDGHAGALDASHILIDLVGNVKVYSPAGSTERSVR